MVSDLLTVIILNLIVSVDCRQDHYFVCSKANSEFNGVYEQIPHPRFHTAFMSSHPAFVKQTEQIYKQQNGTRYFKISFAQSGSTRVTLVSYKWELFSVPGYPKRYIYGESSSPKPTIIQFKYHSIPEESVHNIIQFRSIHHSQVDVEYQKFVMNMRQSYSDAMSSLSRAIDDKLSPNVTLISLDELQSIQRFNVMCVASIVIVTLVCLLSTVMWFKNAREAKHYRLRHINQSMKHHKHVPSMTHVQDRINNPKQRISIHLKNEDKKCMRVWNPEAFSDMLDNSNMVQEVIVEDIVEQMRTEGHSDVINNDEGCTPTQSLNF